MKQMRRTRHSREHTYGFRISERSLTYLAPQMARHFGLRYSLEVGTVPSRTCYVDQETRFARLYGSVVKIGGGNKR